MNENKINILLADDDKDDCILFEEVLKELPIPTSLTKILNGEALMQYLTIEKDNSPDMLFLDLNMPRKNGIECLMEIKSHKRLKKIPVIVFSTSFNEDIVNLLFKNGAKYYIRKPNEFVKLKKVIHHAISSATKPETVNTSKENFVLEP